MPAQIRCLGSENTPIGSRAARTAGAGFNSAEPDGVEDANGVAPVVRTAPQPDGELGPQQARSYR
jgi:hypothetical protein